MRTQTFALIYGVAFLAIGIAGFIPGLTVPHANPEMVLDAWLVLALGLFPVNILHNLVHIAFGLWGLAARSYGAARTYARSVAIVYGALTIMGFIPVLRTTFGLVPLYGHDIWLHAVLALIAAYFGFAGREPERTVAL